ncbi:MAG TPA: protoheme IX farnesyltransferase [Ignavibacteria bacterium]|nr:protoheme IX farnesyltransferase [Ignavibacteria bacterium]HRA99980.1 protoheme IX farnesyltransferase [Ignavibacteria bacterium]
MTKIRITILVALTTSLGYILALTDLSAFSLYPVIGIFLLACGAAAMNHYQERGTDVLMDRTKGRPIPSGNVSASFVITVAIVFLLAGSAVLFFKSSLLTLYIGLFTFLWYNVIYTPLKKVMALAIIPGSLVGALPPMAGWAAAGGSLTDDKILLIGAYFFIWQIPHFWLLLLVYGKDYDKGGFPTLTNMLSQRQLIKITFTWILLTIAVALSINFFGILNYYISNAMLMILCLWMFVRSVKFLDMTEDKKSFKGMFISINIFTLLIITILSVDKLVKLFLE